MDVNNGNRGYENEHDVKSNSTQDDNYHDDYKAAADVDPILKISIHEVEFHLTRRVTRLLEDASTRQVFISFDFLSYPPEALETHSIPFDRSGILSVSYAKCNNNIFVKKKTCLIKNYFNLYSIPF